MLGISNPPNKIYIYSDDYINAVELGLTPESLCPITELKRTIHEYEFKRSLVVSSHTEIKVE
jgi:hypothetical protein